MGRITSSEMSEFLASNKCSDDDLLNFSFTQNHNFLESMHLKNWFIIIMLSILLIIDVVCIFILCYRKKKEQKMQNE